MARDLDVQYKTAFVLAHKIRESLMEGVRQHGLPPEKVTIDQSGANVAALEALKEETGTGIEIRQIKYLNNQVEQDHRAVK
jgi:transposase-like protein